MERHPMQERTSTPFSPGRPPSPAGHPSLTPRPGRSLAWACCRAARGTWFLVLAHLGALAGLLGGAAVPDWLLLPAFLAVRGLTTTVAYHRYFAHRSFKTGRAFQFLLGCLCCTNLQRGPLWWAAVHRQHHRHADGPGDPHSPARGGFLWAYGGWMFAALEEPDWGRVRDLTRFPELVWLERLWLVPPLLLAAGCWLVGGWGLVCVGFCLSAVVALHGASLVNTLGHLVGSRRYPTPDRSRNSLVLALLTFGDGWHNNHHHYPHAAQAGFFRWEADGSFRLIRLLEFAGLVWDVRRVPPHKLHPPLDGRPPAGQGRTD
jgi:stearoyl-CoA desaturase (Delta-9 desaturase)